jgi:cobalt-zinc-cadmium efflux system outer membrane protein
LQHPLVEAARARVEAARGVRVDASAWPNPVTTVWMENTGFVGQHLHGLNRELSTYVTMPLEPLIQRSARIRRADEDVSASEASLRAARRQVAADAVRALLRAAMAQRSVAEAERVERRLDELRAYNQARVGEGFTAELELMRVQVERERASTDVALTHAELQRSIAVLMEYLGPAAAECLNQSELTVAVDDGALNLSSLPPFESVVTEARARRPELQAARARTAAAAASEDYERTLAVRQVGATVGSKRIEGQHTMVAAFSIALPLFSRNQGGVARAVNERLAVEQELGWADRSVAADVRSAYEAATHLTAELGSLQLSFLAQAEEVHRLTVGAYQESGATLLQVLDATRMLADARLAYARVLFAQRQTMFDLALSTGAEPDAALDLLHVWSGPASTTATPGAVQ